MTQGECHQECYISVAYYLERLQRLRATQGDDRLPDSSVNCSSFTANVEEYRVKIEEDAQKNRIEVLSNGTASRFQHQS